MVYLVYVYILHWNAQSPFLSCSRNGIVDAVATKDVIEDMVVDDSCSKLRRHMDVSLN